MSGYYPSRGRSSFRARGASSYGAPRTLPGDRDIMDDLSPTPLQTIAQIFPRESDSEVKITDLDYLGSYNWANRVSPTIIVPGSPPEWRNRPFPYQVQPDTGISFKHQNGYRYPKSVLLPLFIAVDQKAKIGGDDTNWASLDFVTDRNNLRKLLRWIGGENTVNFRIDMQLAGKKTVLFNRWENRDKEEMSGYTFGFNFEKESTRLVSGCEESTGHHRIVKYDLNGLQIVVRFEVDAQIVTEPVSKKIGTKAKPHDAIDNIIGALSGVNIGVATKSPTTVVKGMGNSNITVIHAGSTVQQSSILELTTRSRRNAESFHWQESYPQLFLSQTPHHFLAVHERGRFVEVQKRQLESTELKQVAADLIQDDLKKLRRVLDVIKKVAVKHGETGRLSLVCKDGELKVYERLNRDSCLPDGILERFNV